MLGLLVVASVNLVFCWLIVFWLGTFLFKLYVVAAWLETCISLLMVFAASSSLRCCFVVEVVLVDVVFFCMLMVKVNWYSLSHCSLFSWSRFLYLVPIILDL